MKVEKGRLRGGKTARRLTRVYVPFFKHDSVQILENSQLSGIFERDKPLVEEMNNVW
jgi:hypothetical protein